MTTTDPEVAGIIRQLGTHRKLVISTEQRKLDARLALDAIVVPAARAALNLDSAITLARAARSALLILCSHKAASAEVRQLLARRSFDDAIVIDLPENYCHDLLYFPALASIKDQLPKSCSYYITNLSIKRNLGLVLARMLGWRCIFFLDDDIRDVGYPDLMSTVSMLAHFRTAGMRVTQFPDNSAACHAHRATGGVQDVFLSGSALAVNAQQNIGFFPDIYNEDWFFFYDDVANGKLGSSRREITQLRYNPFADPRRAAWQEFGDVLAEGLYALLDRGLGMEYSTSDYWVEFLSARRTLLEAIVRRSGMATPEIRDELMLSVESALECSMTIEPGLLQRYISLWRQDLNDWERRLANVPQMSSLMAALNALGLEPAADGWAANTARSWPRSLGEEPRTAPNKLFELYDLLESGADPNQHTSSGQLRRAKSKRWDRFLPQRSMLIDPVQSAAGGNSDDVGAAQLGPVGSRNRTVS